MHAFYKSGKWPLFVYLFRLQYIDVVQISNRNADQNRILFHNIISNNSNKSIVDHYDNMDGFFGIETGAYAFKFVNQHNYYHHPKSIIILIRFGLVWFGLVFIPILISYFLPAISFSLPLFHFLFIWIPNFWIIVM